MLRGVAERLKNQNMSRVKIRTRVQSLPIPLQAVTLKIVFRLFRGWYLEDFRMAQGSTYIVGCPTTQPLTKLGCLGLLVI